MSTMSVFAPLVMVGNVARKSHAPQTTVGQVRVVPGYDR